VAHRLGSAKPKLTFDPDDGDAGTLMLEMKAIAGEELPGAEIELVKDPNWKGALRVARAARANPTSAIQLVRQLHPAGLSKVPAAVQIMLLAEATRQPNATDLIDLFGKGELSRKETRDQVIAYVTGGPAGEELAEMPLEFRAAMDFARSRVPGLAGKERKDALERAKASDVLHGPVSVAIEAWTL
jgi:hypothetical protein